MFIVEFHKKFTSSQEKSRLFHTLRRLSRLDGRAFMADDTAVGWPDWPPLTPKCPGLEKA